jgi:hypothetical protein
VQTAAILMQVFVVSECKYCNFMIDYDNDDNNNNICRSVTMYKLNDRAVRHKTSSDIP